MEEHGSLPRNTSGLSLLVLKGGRQWAFGTGQRTVRSVALSSLNNEEGAGIALTRKNSWGNSLNWG